LLFGIQATLTGIFIARLAKLAIDLNRAKPIFKTLPGWKCDISGIRCFEDLPKAAQNYVNELEVLIGYPITIVTNGPNRNDFIKRRPNI